MEEFLNVVKAHIARYPGMEPQDLVKLIYQGEFGPAHLICDPENAFSYLKKEYESVVVSVTPPLWEDIGGGLGRIYLAALLPDQLPALCRAFVASAGECRGSMERFEEKLRLLETSEIVNLPELSFSQEELARYLAAYSAAGFPAVSHSSTYRALYRPSYRVVLKRLAEEELL